MLDIIDLFQPYLLGLFDEHARFTAIPNNKIRVDQSNFESKVGSRTSQSIVLDFEPYVIKAYTDATKLRDQNTLEKYAKSLHTLIRNRMLNYDPDGDKSYAFQIYIDSRATDL